MSDDKNAIVIQQGRDTLAVLQSAGFKILEAKDGIEGVRKAIRHRPDVMIVKVELPHLNGFSMLKILQTFRVKIPVIFTSNKDYHRVKSRQFESTIGFLNDSQIKDELLPLLMQGVANFEWQYFDPLYRFREHEWADLLGTSDRKRILLVEDSRMMRTFSLSTLDPTDEFELYSAQDGLEGVYKALLTQPDLILSDIEMPVVDGLTMSQLLFILGKPFPIVFLTAKSDNKIVLKAKNLEGVIGYILKSQVKDSEAFLEQIQHHLGLADLMREASEATYREGSLEQLAKMGSDKGVLNPGQSLSVSPRSQQRFMTQHAKGLGGFWKQDS